MRQIVGNIKESCVPYLMEQLRLAKLSFDLFGALSPTQEAPKSWPQETKKEDVKEEEENTEVNQEQQQFEEKV